MAFIKIHPLLVNDIFFVGKVKNRLALPYGTTYEPLLNRANFETWQSTQVLCE
jgi:hypothetical protein